MLSKETKLRLVHAVTDQKIADEIEKRLTAAKPTSPAEAQAILDTLNTKLDADMEYRLIDATTDAAAGKYLAKKLIKLVDVLKAVADGSEIPSVPAVAAEFTGQPSGLLTPITLVADEAGVIGNSILLTGDGAKDVATLISDWNTANPANTVALTSGVDTQIVDLGEEIQLAGGVDEIPAADGNLAPAKAAMGNDQMSADTLYRLTHALTSVDAANEFNTALKALIANVQSL